MTLINVEEAIARIPIWKDATDLQVSLLRGGMTNYNYRVDVGGKSFALRISGDNTEMLGIDRENEYRANLIAGELEIAPEVVYFIKSDGLLVTRFIAGRPIPPEEIRQPENIQRVAATLHKIHTLPKFPGVFSAFQVVRDYEEIARRYKVLFPENFKWLFHQMKD